MDIEEIFALNETFLGENWELKKLNSLGFLVLDWKTKFVDGYFHKSLKDGILYYLENNKDDINYILDTIEHIPWEHGHFQLEAGHKIWKKYPNYKDYIFIKDFDIETIKNNHDYLYLLIHSKTRDLHRILFDIFTNQMILDTSSMLN